MDKSRDAAFVEEFRKGNNEALNKLVRRWHKHFCNKAFWLVKDPDLAKDIAQDCWTTIIDKIDTLKDSSSFKYWALRIVYSKSLDELRKNSKERIKKQAYKHEQPKVVEEPIYTTELKKQLLLKIKDLPEHQQTVIKLFYSEDYSLIEISDILNISVGTAKSRLFHARETLKKTLKDRNYEN